MEEMNEPFGISNDKCVLQKVVCQSNVKKKKKTSIALAMLINGQQQYLCFLGSKSILI
jgi:hypothetical protein